MIAYDHSPIRWPGLFLLALGAACGERSPQSEPPAAGNQAPAWLTWTVADSGYGPIVIGMTAELANAAVGGSLELPAGTEACAYAVPRGADSLAFMIEQGKVVRIDVRRSDVATAEGARVGDSEARIQQLYPGRVQISPHKYTDGHYLTVVPSDTAAHPYRLIFETDSGVVRSFRAGVLPQVAYVEGCS